MIFQPKKLKEVVEIVDLMGNISSRVREDSSGDLGGGGTGASGTQGQQGGGQQGTSARDQAIAKAPPIPIMKKKLTKHLELEVRTMQRQAMLLSRSGRRGSAYLLTELYKKIRRISMLISELANASAAMIRRFYIAVFIDRQPLVVPGGTLIGMDGEEGEEE